MEKTSMYNTHYRFNLNYEEKRLFLLFCLTFCFIFSVCNDEKLAKAVNGRWNSSVKMKDEYGVPYTENQTYQFTYIENDAKNGGVVKEYVEATMMEEVSDIEVTYTIGSSICGEYEFIWGDLYIVYDLSSLDVKISNVGYKIADDTDILTKMNYVSTALDMALAGQELIDKKKLTKEIQKNTYQSLYENYKSANNDGDGCYCKEVNIGNNIMSFKTADIGQISLCRVSNK